MFSLSFRPYYIISNILPTFLRFRQYVIEEVSVSIERFIKFRENPAEGPSSARNKFLKSTE